MSNPFFEATGGNGAMQNGAMNFVQFMMQNKGKNADDLLSDMVSSGKINQDQLNQAQQMGKQISSQFGALKSMFGFK